MLYPSYVQDAIEYATQQDTTMVGLSAKGSAFQGLGFKVQGFGPFWGSGFGRRLQSSSIHSNMKPQNARQYSAGQAQFFLNPEAHSFTAWGYDGPKP